MWLLAGFVIGMIFVPPLVAVCASMMSSRISRWEERLDKKGGAGV